MFPSEGNKYNFRNEELDIKIKLSFFDTGISEKCIDKLREFGIVSTFPSSSPEKKLKSSASFIGSQISEPTGPTMFLNNDSSYSLSAGQTGQQPNAALLAGASIRKVLPLIPTTLPWACDVSRQMRTSVDNTLYLYLNQFDRFQAK